MADLSERNRITLLMMRGWRDQQKSYKTITRLFNKSFCNENNGISKSTIVRTIQCFEDTGSLKSPRSGRRKTASNDDKALDVLQSFVEDPHTSINGIT